MARDARLHLSLSAPVLDAFQGLARTVRQPVARVVSEWLERQEEAIHRETALRAQGEQRKLAMRAGATALTTSLAVVQAPVEIRSDRVIPALVAASSAPVIGASVVVGAVDWKEAADARAIEKEISMQEPDYLQARPQDAHESRAEYSARLNAGAMDWYEAQRQASRLATPNKVAESTDDRQAITFPDKVEPVVDDRPAYDVQFEDVADGPVDPRIEAWTEEFLATWPECVAPDSDVEAHNLHARRRTAAMDQFITRKLAE